MCFFYPKNIEKGIIYHPNNFCFSAKLTIFSFFSNLCAENGPSDRQWKTDGYSAPYHLAKKHYKPNTSGGDVQPPAPLTITDTPKKLIKSDMT